jgi:hypothetical protein|tara:strand:+ start:6830 stop:7552 length:723 start_codon:yes stop_codon:yes gene_type:complete
MTEKPKEIFETPYILKNTMLGIKGEWMLDKTTWTLVQSSLKEIKEFIVNDGKYDLETDLTDYPKELVKDVYSVPLFTKEFCEMMVDEIKNMQDSYNLEFEANETEDYYRQIPEITLADNVPVLHDVLWSVAQNVLNPVFFAVWQRYCSRVGSIQLANYNPTEKEKGAWHHDQSADISVVVPLNTGDYTGGGTEFYNRGVVDPLPNGSALFFPSFTHMHRGQVVQEGDRYLLVFWLLGSYD